ncbi:hypothetical protein ATI61_10473 [Archangium gephyra]|uniref:Uncharacterized protein n=1 Tax=Archangium gephyra TaxID=48 RepID=A0AAC8Q3W6_9BACT|nr:hypothetical protein [Archangium gephyra]AKJ00521.1 Hypothetical protein AA314_02147 [Archangium gephyra]REG32786.1 hypothetical protein ATI61_10473 [Archangium gephyra]
MVSLIAVLLAVAPLPGQVSLLEPAPLETRPSARLLVAQQAPSESREVRIRELTREVEELNARLRTTSSNWPVGAIAMTYAGYVLSPLLLVGVPMLIYGLVVGTQYAYALTITAVGAALTVLGGGGVALLIVGIVSGLEASERSKAERNELILKRSRLEDELRELKRSGPAASVQPWRDGRAESFIPVAALSF